MKAISKLRQSGLTTAQIAAQVPCTTHALRYYERGKRFPSEELYSAITALASSRGITLLATDFVVSEGKIAAERQEGA